jgi:hypothetical protein
MTCISAGSYVRAGPRVRPIHCSLSISCSPLILVARATGALSLAVLGAVLSAILRGVFIAASSSPLRILEALAAKSSLPLRIVIRLSPLASLKAFMRGLPTFVLFVIPVRLVPPALVIVSIRHVSSFFSQSVLLLRNRTRKVDHMRDAFGALGRFRGSRMLNGQLRQHAITEALARKLAKVRKRRGWQRGCYLLDRAGHRALGVWCRCPSHWLLA